MATLTIGELAERSGFSTSALRYYEEVGVLPSAERTPSGYRVYDESAVACLAFVGRAKELGCTLEEIADLVRVWHGDECADVQHRLRMLVSSKIDAADARLRDLIAVTGDLRRAMTQLDALPTAGGCDEDCVCLANPPGDQRRLVGPMLGSPVACTLSIDDAPDRLADWQAVLSEVVERVPVEDGLRLTLSERADLAEVGRLLVAEHGCCSFLRFALTMDDRGVAIEIGAPGDARDLVVELFGTVAA